jgi:hypothetical protein
MRHEAEDLALEIDHFLNSLQNLFSSQPNHYRVILQILAQLAVVDRMDLGRKCFRLFNIMIMSGREARRPAVEIL